MDISHNLSNLTQVDRDTGVYMIKLENERRAKLEPPGTPLPFGTAGEIKSSYETVFNAIDQAAHASYILQAAENHVTAKQIREALKEPRTPTQLSAALTALTS